jgi:hypothetical protein
MKKIMITTMFLCSLSALQGQTGPKHPTEPNFLQEKKPTMQKYFFEKSDLEKLHLLVGMKN